MRVARKTDAILSTNAKIYDDTQAAHHAPPPPGTHAIDPITPHIGDHGRVGKASNLPVFLAELLLSQKNA